MQLILFRHGIAEDQRADLPDADRRLTAEGVARTRQAARGLASVIGRPDAILTSPKRRAAETADLLGQTTGVSPTPLDVLAEGSTDAVLHALSSRDEDTLVLVGHEPTFSMVAEQLCLGAPHSFIELKKAGAVVLRIDRVGRTHPAGVLEALLTPRVLRSLATHHEQGQ